MSCPRFVEFKTGGLRFKVREEMFKWDGGQVFPCRLVDICSYQRKKGVPLQFKIHLVRLEMFRWISAKWY